MTAHPLRFRWRSATPAGCSTRMPLDRVLTTLHTRLDGQRRPAGTEEGGRLAARRPSRRHGNRRAYLGFGSATRRLAGHHPRRRAGRRLGVRRLHRGRPGRARAQPGRRGVGSGTSEVRRHGRRGLQVRPAVRRDDRTGARAARRQRPARGTARPRGRRPPHRAHARPAHRRRDTGRGRRHRRAGLQRRPPHHGLWPALAPAGDRRRAADALRRPDGAGTRLHGDDLRSARGIRRRLAGARHAAGAHDARRHGRRVPAGQAHGHRRPHPRPQARRPGADGSAEVRCFLRGRDRLAEEPGQAQGTAAGVRRHGSSSSTTCTVRSA